MNLIKVLSNPVKMQIVQYLAVHGASTTKQISDELSDIPAATLYRHINALIELGLIAVKEERKVRGSVERLLDIDQERINTSGSVSDQAYQFLMALYNKFYIYDQKPDKDPVRDHLAMATAMFIVVRSRIRDRYSVHIRAAVAHMAEEDYKSAYDEYLAASQKEDITDESYVEAMLGASDAAFYGGDDEEAYKDFRG